MSETVALDMDWYDGETNEYQSNLYPGTNANGIPNTYHQVSPPEIHHPVSESPFPGNLGSHTIPNPRQHLVNNTTTQQNFFVPKFNHSSAAEQGEDTSEEEEPLLYELGVNFQHIIDKTLAVLNILKPVDRHLMDDTDLAGPLVFCLAYSAFLLMSGKLEFGSVYGLAVIGCIGMNLVLALMTHSPDTSVSLSRTASVLGYCLLPMVALSSVAILLSLSGTFGSLLTVLSVAWCTHSAARIFTTVLQMDHQRILVAYPCVLIYGVFALLTVF
eukprot:gene616-3926_t